MSAMFPVTVILHHERPVSMVVLAEAISVINEAAMRSVAEVFERVIAPRLKLDQATTAQVIAQIRATQDDMFWLESVETGSSKFKGSIRATIIFVGGTIAGGTLDHSKHWDNWMKTTGGMTDTAIEKGGDLGKKALDEIKELAANRINGQNESGDDRFARYKAVVDGDRLRIDVYPRPDKTDFGSKT